MSDENDAATALDRRDFLTRVAWFVACAGAGSLGAGVISPSVADAQPVGPLAAVDAVVLDTLRGVCVMVFPGPDEWSRVQGTPRAGPGVIEVGGGEFMMGLFDNYLAAGDQLARPLALAFGQALDELGIPAPLLGLSPEQGRRIDQSLGYMYSDRILPLSVLVMLALNFGAVLVAPGTLVGPLGSPFARLSLRDKCRVLELLERPIPELVSIVDRGLPAPLRGSGTGFLRFAGGLVLESAAFSVHSEMEMFDPRTRTVSGRPPSWELTGYRPDGLVDGHPELIGYYQGRTEVRDA
ncbi:twin-arginine translocation signal domain-containing protein [Nocardia iowensis]|uniref:Twin-arginine translocation signal domain-containing protein n=1 Tax=Nocardia iowensis TaxID=204891 RepID=A0ABX8RWZ1_NOCIO|nr:twin-arginine translocation signal domain-containing protein [Nocardia iowensis]QXN94078.1 twin-arginine translocation signal domain-containing protein [Nocardia iowensis]